MSKKLDHLDDSLFIGVIKNLIWINIFRDTTELDSRLQIYETVFRENLIEFYAAERNINYIISNTIFKSVNCRNESIDHRLVFFVSRLKISVWSHNLKLLYNICFESIENKRISCFVIPLSTLLPFRDTATSQYSFLKNHLIDNSRVTFMFCYINFIHFAIGNTS